MSHNEAIEFENAVNGSGPLQSEVVARWQKKIQDKSRRQSTVTGPNIGMHDQIDMERTSYNINQNRESSNNPEVPSDIRVLAYKETVPTPEVGYQNKLRVLYSKNATGQVSTTIPTRPLPSSPEKTLNAPDLKNDYYLNLLDWGVNNIVAIALDNTVYLWNASTSNTECINACQPGSYVCSISWLKDGGDYLAIGTSDNEIQLWDTQSMKRIQTMGGHQNRIDCLAWNHYILSSGSRDTQIINHDVRDANKIVSVYHGHEQEVCNIAWSLDGKYLASGGNDNRLCIFTNDFNQNQNPLFTLTDHMAAVKALAWCPYQRNLLASGGGTADRSIKLWNVSTGTLLNNVDTGSQVCSLCWNPHEKELLSSHGYAKNQLSLWKYPNMSLIKEFFSHESRALHLAVSPDGTMVCSAGADCILAFWRIFGTSQTEKKTVSQSMPFSSFGCIR